MITAASLEEMSFGALINWAVENFQTHSDPDVKRCKTHQEVISYVTLKKGGNISPELIRDVFQDLGFVADAGATKPVAVPVPSRSEVIVIDAGEDPSPKGKPVVAAAADEAVAMVPETPAPAPVTAPQETTNYHAMPLLKDEKGRLRSEDGRYVCPLCVRDKVDGPFLAHSTKQFGPHSRTHEDSKNRGWVDALIPGLPLYSGPEPTADKAPEKPAEVPAPVVPPAAPEIDANAHRTLSEVEDPGPLTMSNENLLENTLPGMVAPPSTMDADEIERRTQVFMNTVVSDLMKRLDSMESLLANTMVVLLSMPEEGVQRFFEEYAKARVPQVSQLLTRGE